VQTYTVHEPRRVTDDAGERATRLVFVKEGFSILALLAPIIWLLLNRLWRELLVYVLLIAAVIGLLSWAGGNETAIGWATFLVNLLFAFEARDLHRGALARKGYTLTGIVSGRNLEDSERSFLREWLPEARGYSRPSRDLGNAEGGRYGQEPVGMLPAS